MNPSEPQTPEALLQQVSSLLSSGGAQQALQIAEDGVRRFPSSTALYNLAGICAATLGDSARAEQHWRQALALNPNDAQVHYNLGLLLTQGNRIQEAEQYYRKAIALTPNNAACHSNLGALLVGMQRLDEAEQCYRQAIALDPLHATAHFNLGLLLADLKRPDEAEQCYRTATALDPGNALPHLNLGVLLENRHQNIEAEQHYRSAITLAPQHAAAYSNLGALLTKSRRYQEAEQCYRQAIALDPSHAMTHFNLGALAAKLERSDEAEQCYRRAITLDPGHAMAYSNLGVLLMNAKRYQEAEQSLEKAIALDPSATESHTNLGLLLQELDRNDEAEHHYRKAIELEPRNAAVHTNLALFLTHIKREKDAEQSFKQAITLDPDHALAQVNLSFLLLRQGRFDEGWPYYEARHALAATVDGKRETPAVPPFPEWQGEPLAGKSLLVWPEQGLGDEIQFCRYLPLLKQQGAMRITLVCKPSLKTLMETLEGVDKVISLDDAKGAVPRHDWWVSLLSIPMRCKTTVETIPARLPYLRTLPERAAKWSAFLPQDGLRVGLAWKGNNTYSNDANRSLADLTILAPLWSVPGVRFISLQKGPGQDQARQPPAGQALLDPGDEIGDFADTAAIIEQLDLVISVDTAVAHLAGALAKPCWLMLPAEKNDWRWLQDRDDSPWYPGVLRLFRQAHSRDWGPVVTAIKKALNELADHP